MISKNLVNRRNISAGKNALYLKTIEKKCYKEISRIITTIIIEERWKYEDKKIQHIYSKS